MPILERLQVSIPTYLCDILIFPSLYANINVCHTSIVIRAIAPLRHKGDIPSNSAKASSSQPARLRRTRMLFLA